MAYHVDQEKPLRKYTVLAEEETATLADEVEGTSFHVADNGTLFIRKEEDGENRNTAAYSAKYWLLISEGQEDN